MDLVYSSHAKKRMMERGIEEWEIEHVIQYPSYIKKTIFFVFWMLKVFC
ncbi:MAG: DUF4258 domain-containing protein [Nanoarchaeota archaeon]